MQLNKETQIILAVGAVAVSGYFVYKSAQGVNDAAVQVGTGIGHGIEAGAIIGAFAFALFLL